MSTKSNQYDEASDIADKELRKADEAQNAAYKAKCDASDLATVALAELNVFNASRSSSFRERDAATAKYDAARVAWAAAYTACEATKTLLRDAFRARNDADEARRNNNKGDK